MGASHIKICERTMPGRETSLSTGKVLRAPEQETGSLGTMQARKRMCGKSSEM